MKKLMMAAVALLFTVNMTQAQDQRSATPQPATIDAATAKPATVTAAEDGTVLSDVQAPAADAAKCDMKNRCIKKGGRMYCIKDGKETAMTEDMKMSNGTTVTPDGTCMTRDGKKMVMKDGECMDMSGKVCLMPPASEKAKPATTK